MRPAVEALPVMKDALFAGTRHAQPGPETGARRAPPDFPRTRRARRGLGGVIERRQTFSLMLNEEDHLRMQAIRPGLQLRRVQRAV
jgi:protein arginine kinase